MSGRLLGRCGGLLASGRCGDLAVGRCGRLLASGVGGGRQRLLSSAVRTGLPSSTAGRHCASCRLSPLAARAPAWAASQAASVRRLHRGGRLEGAAGAADPTRHGRPDPTRHGRPDLLYSQIDIELRTHDVAVLDSYTQFLTTAARHLDVTVGSVWDPPRHIERMSLLKSVHVFGKHKVQYEVRTMFRVLRLRRLTGSTADTLLEYCQRMLPEGIAMKVTRYAREPLPDHLITPGDLPPVVAPQSPPDTPPEAGPTSGGP